jgi:hypothetical protein
MKSNKYLSISTIIVTIASFILSLCWHSSTNIQTKYWTNIMFAIFGSGLLSAFASVTSYFSECRKYEIANLAFTRNLLVQTGNSLRFIQHNNPNPEVIYRELLNLCSIFDNYAFENYPIIEDYYFHSSNRRRELKERQVKVEKIWQKLMQAKNLSQNAGSKQIDDSHNTLFALLKDIDDSCNDLISIIKPKKEDSVVKSN